MSPALPADGSEAPRPLGIRRAGVHDVPELHALAWASFEAEVAPHYSDEGVSEYRQFSSAEAIEERMAKGHDFWLVESPDGVALAMAEVRDGIHLAMLFVQPGSCGQGTGSLLVDSLAARSALPMTVCASVNAVGFYSKRGFEVAGPEQDEAGIRFVPMRKG